MTLAYQRSMYGDAPTVQFMRALWCVKRLQSWLRSRLACLLLAAAAAALCGIFVHREGFVVLTSLSAALLLGVAWPWLALRGLVAELTFDRTRVHQGQPCRVTLHIRRRGFLPAWGVRLRADCAEVEGVELLGFGGRGWRRHTWEFTPSRRGFFPGATPLLVCDFPFGLWQSHKAVKTKERLLAWPRIFAVTWKPEDGRGGAEAARACSEAGTSGEIVGVRAYRRGDPLRLVHWRQSARHDELVVRELQETSRPHVRLVLDARLSNETAEKAGPMLELAISTAASLFESLTRRQIPVSVSIHGESSPGVRDLSSRNGVFDALAQVPPNGFPRRTISPREECRRAGREVFITPAALLESDVIEARQHVIVVAPDRDGLPSQNVIIRDESASLVSVMLR